MSNPGCLSLCPPASSQLISGDASHRPDRESFYPENNPSLLPPQRKAVAHFLLYCSLPHYFPWLIVFSSCLHLSLSNHIPLLFYLLGPLPVFSTPSTLFLQMSFLRWWESPNRCRDCQLRNSPHFLQDSSAFKICFLFHRRMLLKSMGLYHRAHL